jgi:tRNA(Ile)-lysidine synthase
VRPLLAFSRDDITLFAIKNGIVWREDRSNASIKYVRNKVRHKVIPILKELNPHVLESFQNTIEYLNESQSIINDAVKNITANVVSYKNDVLKISCKEIEKFSNKKAYLYQLLQAYGFTAWNDIVDLISAQPGKQIFSNTHRLLKDRNFLILTTINKSQSIKGPILIDQKVSEITNPIKLTIQNTDDYTSKNKEQIIIDKDLVNYPLSLKKWHHGDAMYPTGMIGSKKISQLFKDNKLSLLDKEKIWILADAKDHIIWVIGLRQDRRYLANKTSKNRLKISYL